MKEVITSIVLVFIASIVSAEIIQLKSGETIEGNIIAQSNEEIKVEIGSNMIITYYNDEVAYIAPSLSKESKEDIQKDYYPSGTLWREIKFIGGKKALQKEYTEEGNLEAEIIFINGEISLEKEYGKEGRLEEETYYQEGKAFLDKVYYASGKIAEEIELNSKEEPHGLIKKYYKNGSIKREIDYSNDIKNGKENFYSENGKLQSSLSYKNETLDSDSKFFDKNGDLIVEMSFEEGDLIGIKVQNKEYLK